MRKRFIGLLLIFSMIMSLVPVAANAAIVDSGECGARGDNLTWTLDDTGTLIISGKGKVRDYYPWDDNRLKITKVVIEQGVTNIGEYAFYSCSSLTSVDISNSVISIGERAFSGCSSLTSVDISNSVISIGEYAFYSCSSLTSIAIGDGVTSISDGMFSGCSSLTSVVIPDSVTSIGEDAFYDCRSLTSIDIPDSITSIGECAFCGCSSLTSVDIPDSATSIGNSAFFGCSSLTSVVIPDSVTSIGELAFYLCEKLKSIAFPDSLTTIGANAFTGCNTLTNITIPKNVENIGIPAFLQCENLSEINVASDNMFYTSQNGILFDKNMKKLIKYPEYLYNWEEWGNAKPYIVPDGVEEICDSALANLYSLPQITLPDSLKIIGNNAFEDCHDLINITIPANVVRIGDMPFYCSSLVKINVYKDNKIYCDIDGVLFNKDKTILIAYPNGKQGIYTVPDTVIEIGEYAFWGSYQLTGISIPNSVTSIKEGAFSRCSELSSIIIPDSITEIADVTFDTCTSLTKVSIPYSVTQIGFSAFLGCDNLKDVYYGGNNRTWQNIDIKYGNEHLTNANIHFNDTFIDVDNTSIKFTPIEPSSETTHSKILDGGTAIRYYSVTDEAGEPYVNQKINYTFNDIDIYSATTNKNGILEFKIPNIYAPYGMGAGEDYTQWFQAKIVTEKGAERENVTGAPSVLVDVYPRGYTQSAELSYDAGIDKKAEAGIISAKVGAKANNKLSIEYEHSGGQDDKIDLTLSGIRKLTGSSKVGLKLFDNLWSDNYPSFEFSPSAKADASFSYGGKIVLEDFYNKEDPKHTEKALAAGAYTLGTLYNNIVNSPTAEIVINTLCDKISGVATSRETETSLSLAAGGEAKFDIENVFGKNNKLSASAFDGEIESLWSYKTDVPLKVSQNNPSVTTSTLTDKTSSDFFKMGIERKFKPDNQKDSSQSEVGLKGFSNDSLKGFSASTETSRSVSVEKDADDNVQKITLKTQWPSTNGQSFSIGWNEYSKSESFSVSAENETVDEILNSSSAIRNMVNGSNVLLSAKDFENSFGMFSNIENEGTWEITGKDSRLVFNLPLKLPITETVNIGVEVEGKEEIEYTKQSGTYTKDYFITTDEYDGNYYSNEKSPLDYMTVVGPEVINALKDVAGSIISSGAGLLEKGKAALRNIGDSVYIMITQVTSDNMPLQLLAATDESGNLDTAYSIGDVYIVNAVDGDKNIVEDFEEGIELSLSYDGYDCENPDNLDIYYWDDNIQLYQKCNAVLDTENKILTMPFSKNGQYILGVDTSKPTIENLKYSIIDGNPYIIADIYDDFSAIDETTIEMAIDSNVVIDSGNINEYYDKRSKKLTYPLTEEWSGTHTVTILAGDVSGNISDAAQIDFTYLLNSIQISHEPILDAEINTDITINANVTNATECYLAYRNIANEAEYNLVEMNKAEDLYSFTIDGANVSGDIEYYIMASDDYGNINKTSKYNIWIDKNTPVFINSMNMQRVNDNIEVSVTIAKPDYDVSDALVIVGLYDINGALIELKTNSLDESNQIFNFKNNDKIQYAKAYIWNNMQQIEPMARSLTCFF